MNKLPEEEKLQFLSEMKNFIEEEDRWLQNLMGQIGWSIEDFPKFLQANPVKYKLCPINNEHRVPENSLENHVLKCSKKYEIYPDSSEEAFCPKEETADDTANKSKTNDLALFQPSNEGSASASQSSSSQCLIELLTAERDAKRRRAAYRKKRVHMNKKSYNEILRELIDNEMKTLECSKTDEDFGDDSNSANIIEEHGESSSIYAGVGNWIYTENPYKRWMTIKKEEEELESLRIKDSKKQIHFDNQSKHSRDSTRHFSKDRYSLDHNSDYSSNPRELAHFPRGEYRHYDKRPMFSSSSRHSSKSGVYSQHKERTDRNLSRRDHKRYDYSDDDKKMEESRERRRFSKTYISSVKREPAIETTESSFKSSERLRSKKSVDESTVNKEEARMCDESTKRKHEEKYSKSSGRSSSSSDMEVQQHKKKKKHKKKHKNKHTKKTKKRRNSLQSP